MSTKNTSTVPEIQLATGEQIEHIMDMWRRRLKGRNVTLAEANHIIQNGNLYLPVMDKAADVLVDQVRSDMQNTIVRMVRNIRRNRSAQQTITDTGRNEYLTDSVVATMPVGQGPEEIELVYFRLGRYVYADELETEYEARGLMPDPQAQAADNEADPAFADQHPNGCYWDREDKKHSYLTFSRWNVERDVDCDRDDSLWDDDWWFAGVRKS